MDIVQSVRWSDDGRAVRILDQRDLPGREVWRELSTLDDVCSAIQSMAVRGAPAIGIAGAMGLVVAMEEHQHLARAEFVARCRAVADTIRSTRRTAVNLAWALDRLLAIADRNGDAPTSIVAHMRAEATAILEEDRTMCRAIGELGAELIPDGARVLTHCNAGALATGGIGTALAAIYVAHERGKRIHVFADETRPLLQGSRLTAWELSRAGVPVSLLVDGAAASLMAQRKVDICIVGADRIVANGDVANKVGTYALAIVARRHGIPFYVAAPTSTFDPSTARGEDIHIEQRGSDEVRAGFGSRTAPPNVDVYNPAFDVTPAELITAIVSDRAVHRAPYDFSGGVDG
jgi:methylthioribose-1-phosphate isomerase